VTGDHRAACALGFDRVNTTPLSDGTVILTYKTGVKLDRGAA
jgi:hypothetical protein